MSPARTYVRNRQEITALQYTGDNVAEVQEFAGDGLVRVHRRETVTKDGQEVEEAVLSFDHPLRKQTYVYPGWWFAKKGPHLMLAMSPERFANEYDPKDES